MIEDALKNAKVIPVVTIEAVEDAVPLCRALKEGGLGLVEFTFRSEAAANAIQEVRREMPDFIVGAGTILTVQSLQDAFDAGAQFAVAPGFNVSVVEVARAMKIPFFPGVCTPTEIEAALEASCRTLKFFPAEAAGGLAMLNALYAPYAHLGIQFIPTGGVSESNVAAYLAHPAVLAVGGSWIAPRELIRDKAWSDISERARGALRAK